MTKNHSTLRTVIVYSALVILVFALAILTAACDRTTPNPPTVTRQL